MVWNGRLTPLLRCLCGIWELGARNFIIPRITERTVEDAAPRLASQRSAEAVARIRKRARLEEVRIHDLRHSSASSALALGEGLTMIGKLLGHSDIETTARYAHLAHDSIHETAERISESIAADIL